MVVLGGPASVHLTFCGSDAVKLNYTRLTRKSTFETKLPKPQNRLHLVEISCKTTCHLFLRFDTFKSFVRYYRIVYFTDVTLTAFLTLVAL